VSKVLVYSL